MRHHLLISMLSLLLLAAAPTAQAMVDDIGLREEAAMKAAVDQVSPSVVRIETLGGLETVGQMLVGSGPTTGLIVSPDGYIVSSAFNFAQKPSQILVVLPDGRRLPARFVARDHSRMLVLLKVDEEKLEGSTLAVPAVAQVDQMRVGQWAIAVGRVFDGERPNVSVGIVSALDRIWGKAIQTDAKISPANYGGPLIDIRGRVLGVLVPMSPQKSTELAGVEWYDSGIGFAVPLEHIHSALQRLKQGEDLHPGLLGVGLSKGDPNTAKPVIAACLPKSPAAEAGLKSGDRIVEIDGKQVDTQNEMRHRLAPHYAGDTVTVVVLRDNERLERQIELVEALQPYVHPFLGILPRRDDDSGVTVRYVYPGGPAAEAGIEAGDRLTALAGETIESRLGLQEQLAALEPRQKVELEFERDGEKRSVEIALATLPEAVPEELPPAWRSDADDAGDAAKTEIGKVEIKIPEAANKCFAFVPASYRTGAPHGLLVWLKSAGRGGADGAADDQIIEKWKAACAAHDLILLVPASGNPARWQRTDIEFIKRAIEDALQKYNVDRTRMVVAGQAAGGAMAYLMAANHRDLVRGVAAIDMPLPPAMQVPTTEPASRLAFFSTGAKQSAVAEGIKRLRQAKHPVTAIDSSGQQLSEQHILELARWTDTLDQS